HVSVSASVAEGTVVHNSAHVSSTGTAEGDTTNNDSGDVATTIHAIADLSVTKSDSPDPVIAGNNLTYTITVSNGGPSDAQAVCLADAVAAGTSSVSLSQTTGPTFTCTAPPVRCSITTLAAGATGASTFVVKVAPSRTADVSNTATASSTTTDPTPANNSGTAGTTVITRADLSITKSDSADPVTAGTNLTYTITVDSSGPSDAPGVSVSDPIPAGTSFVSATGGGTYDSGTNTVSWSLGTVAASDPAVVLTLVVAVDPSRTTGISNTATVGSTTTDPTPANNTATETTAVQARADLTVAKSGPASATAGSAFDYTLTVTNHGPSVHTGGITVTDSLPAGTTFQPSTDCTAIGQDVTCSRSATLAVGGTTTFTIHVSVSASVAEGTVVHNSAHVSSTGTTDGDTTNNDSGDVA